MFKFLSRFGVKHLDPHGESARKFVRACDVFCSKGQNRLIAASMFNHAGLWAEKPGGAVSVDFLRLSDINSTVRTILDDCEYKPGFDYSRSKQSDWPAYQESGCKTIKQFESEYLRLFVIGVNNSNHSYDIIAPEFGEFGLELRVTVNAATNNFGEAIHYLVDAYGECTDAVTSRA